MPPIWNLDWCPIFPLGCPHRAVWNQNVFQESFQTKERSGRDLAVRHRMMVIQTFCGMTSQELGIKTLNIAKSNAKNDAIKYAIGKASGNDGKNVYIIVAPHDLGCHSCRFCLVSRCALMFDVMFQPIMHMCIIECFSGRHRGGRNFIHCAVFGTLFSCNKMSLFYLKTCAPVKVKHRLIVPLSWSPFHSERHVFVPVCSTTSFCVMEVCLGVF